MIVRILAAVLLLRLVSSVEAQDYGNIAPQTAIGNPSPSAKQPGAPIPFSAIPYGTPGAKFNSTDDTAAINTQMARGGAMTFPAGTSLVQSKLILGVDGTYVSGAGAEISILKPKTQTATLPEMIDWNGSTNRSGISNLQLTNTTTCGAGGTTSCSPNGILYEATISNGMGIIEKNAFGGFTNCAITQNTAFQGGDNLRLINNFFQNNGAALCTLNWGQNAFTSGNFVLNGAGYNFGMSTNQTEGFTSVGDTILPYVGGQYAIQITSGLDLNFLGNDFSSVVNNHGVIIDASVNPVSHVGLGFGYIGGGAGQPANLDGVHLAGTPEYIPLVAENLIGWSGYGFNTGSGGAQDIALIGAKGATNTLADVKVANSTVTILGSFLESTTPIVDDNAQATLLGFTRCAHPYTQGAKTVSYGAIGCGIDQHPTPMNFGAGNVTQIDATGALKAGAPVTVTMSSPSLTLAGTETSARSFQFIEGSGTLYLKDTTDNAANLTIIDSNNGVVFAVTHSGVTAPYVQAAAGNDILCYNTAGGTVTYASAVAGCVPSSMRFKDIGGPLDGKRALAGIAAATPVSYAYKPEMALGDKAQDGLIAEEVCAIDERLCHRDKNGQVDNYDKVGALALAWAAIKEQQAQIAELRQELLRR